MNVIFLDRDGVINKDVGFLYKKSDIIIYDSTINGLRLLQKKYNFVIITNQSGIAKGIYTEEQFHEVNNHIVEILKYNNIDIMETYYCPHNIDSTCQCRKPSPGMIEKAIEKYSIDKDNSWLFGDRDTDIEAGIRSGIKGIKINSYFNVLDAANFILSNED